MASTRAYGGPGIRIGLRRRGASDHPLVLSSRDSRHSFSGSHSLSDPDHDAIADPHELSDGQPHGHTYAHFHADGNRYPYTDQNPVSNVYPYPDTILHAHTTPYGASSQPNTVAHINATAYGTATVAYGRGTITRSALFRGERSLD